MSVRRTRRLPFKPRIEALEGRLFLAAGPVISEFMASNSNSLVDDEGDNSDWIEIEIDRNELTGSVNLITEAEGVAGGDALLASRTMAPSLGPDPQLPADTRLWAALQDVSGGTWGGAVYDVEKILEVIAAGKKSLGL